MSDILKFGQAIRLAQLSSDPTGVSNGVLYYNTTSNVIKQYLNGSWQEIPNQALTLLGLSLNDGNIIVGNGSNVSVALDTASVGDIDADSSAGLTIKTGVIVNNQISASAAISLSKLAALTASRALVSDGSGVISVSSVTSTELSYVSGVTSAIQTQLGNKIDSSEKGANNGVATLDSGGKVPVSQLPNSVMTYEGLWNASTNSPTLADGSGNAGMVYRVSTAGSQDLGSGSISFAVGDYVIYNSSGVWEKADTTDSVVSVNSQTGIVVLDSDDISEGSTNLYFTDERAQDAVGNALSDSSNIDFTYNDAGNSITADLTDTTVTAGSYGSATQVASFTVDAKGRLTAASNTSISITSSAVSDFNEAAQDAVGSILTDSASVDFTYNDAGNTITAAVLPAGVDHDALANFVANEHVDHSTVQIATASDSGLTGGGDITATRNISVDINGTTASTTADNADSILIYDNSASALRKQTRANFLSGIAVTSAGDINETSFTGLANNTASQSITGFAFNNATVRSFSALVSVFIDATTDSYANYELRGIQNGSGWSLIQSYHGDDITGFSFSITSAGQVQASIGNITGFSTSKISFRAITTTV